MGRCSISPVARLTAPCCLISLILIALLAQPSTCNHDDSEGEEPVDALSVQLSVTAQVTPTPLWAVVWGPTQPLEDETYHFLSSQETDLLHRRGNQQEPTTATSEAWPYLDGSAPPGAEAPLEPWGQGGVEDGGTEAEETEPEEVDPQFYVTVTISSLLILTAVIITAKLCYDRSCSQHPPPLSRGVAPPLSLALPRSLASEDSRQTLHSTSSSFTDRERPRALPSSPTSSALRPAMTNSQTSSLNSRAASHYPLKRPTCASTTVSSDSAAHVEL